MSVCASVFFKAQSIIVVKAMAVKLSQGWEARASMYFLSALADFVSSLLRTAITPLIMAGRACMARQWHGSSVPNSPFSFAAVCLSARSSCHWVRIIISLSVMALRAVSSYGKSSGVQLRCVVKLVFNFPSPLM